MEAKDRFEFYKELYHRENGRRHEVQNALNIPIAISTALLSAFYFFSTTFNYSQSGLMLISFIILLIITAVFLVLAICHLIIAFGGLFTKKFEYSGVPYTQELYDWNKELETYFEEHGGKDAKPLAQEHFRQYIEENLVKHTEHNMYINDKKYANIHNSKKYLILALMATFLIFIPYGICYFNKESTVHRVEVLANANDKTITQINDLKIEVEELKKIIQKKEMNKKDIPVVKPTAPSPPKPPTDRLIKEGANPPKPKAIKEQ